MTGRVIAVDTPALMAIALNEPASASCTQTLADADRLLISAGTVAEALIVATSRGVAAEVEQMLAGLGLEVITVTPAFARQVTAAYAVWGKRNHPAALNFGDCFAYALAKDFNCPLLFVGKDFAKTDVARA